MKRVLGVLIFLTLIIGPTVPPSGVPALAQQPGGCCKVRDALSSSNWRKNGLNHENCKQFNDKRDGDNVLQEAGFVWWDGQCR